jgi:hypothetical protein
MHLFVLYLYYEISYNYKTELKTYFVSVGGILDSNPEIFRFLSEVFQTLTLRYFVFCRRYFGL